jgi:hypothetical protein
MNDYAKQTVDLANWEIFIVALSRVGGNREMTDVETAFVEAHKLAPDRFAWRTKRDLPEYKKLSKALRDADANGQQLMTGTSDGHKRQLTAQGLTWIENNQHRLKGLGDTRFSPGLAKSSFGAGLLARVSKAPEFLAWKKREQPPLPKWRLAEIFKCSPDSPVETWQSRLEQTGAAAHAAGMRDVLEFVEMLKAKVIDEQSQ